MEACTHIEIASNTCKLDVNKILCIKGACTQSNYDADKVNNIDFFVQDVFLTATMFIGTLVSIVLITSAIKFILAGGNMDDAASAKKGIKNALIGLVIVVFSYTIVRMMQFIVAGY